MIIVATNFTWQYSKSNALKKELKNQSFRLQTVKFNLQKRLSYAIKDSIKIQNQSLIFNSINYTSLIGSYDSKWNRLSFYDKNISTSKYIKIINANVENIKTRLKANHNLNDLYLKFNNSKKYHKVQCFNCSNIDNSISLENTSLDYNNSQYFNIISSSYAIALKEDILYLYYNFKSFLNQNYHSQDKSILIKNVKSLKIYDNYMQICLKNQRCVKVDF